MLIFATHLYRITLEVAVISEIITKIWEERLRITKEKRGYKTKEAKKTSPYFPR